MESITWPEGMPTQAFGMQHSTTQNNAGFMPVSTGRWHDGNPSMCGPPAQSSDHNISPRSNVNNGQIVNGNYFYGQSPHLNSLQSTNSYGKWTNINGINEPLPQQSLKDTIVGNGNGQVSSGQYVVPPQYATQHTHLRANCTEGYSPPYEMAVANRGNHNMSCTISENNYYHSQDVLSGRGRETQGHFDIGSYQHFQRRQDLRQGVNVTTSAQISSHVARNPNPIYAQGNAPTGQGMVNKVHGTAKHHQRKCVNSTDAVVSRSSSGPRTSISQVPSSNERRTNPTSTPLFPVGQKNNQHYLQGRTSRSQGPVASNQTATTYPAPGHSNPQTSWSAGSGVNQGSLRNVAGHTQTASEVDAIKRILLDLLYTPQSNTTQGNGCHGTPTAMIPESTPESHQRSFANGNQYISQPSAFRNGSVQNVVDHQPSFHFPGSSVAPNPSCNTNQGSHLTSPARNPPHYTSEQLQGAKSPVRRNAQVAEYQTQRYNGNAQLSCFPRTTNKCVAEGERYVGTSQTGDTAPNQTPESGVERHHGIPSHDLISRYRHVTSLSNPAKQPQEQKRNAQHAHVTPPYPERQRYFVTVTKDRQGKGFTAENVIFMGNQPDNHAPVLQEQVPLSSTEKTAKAACGTMSGKLSDGVTSKKQEKPLASAVIPAAESAFKIPKINQQQNCTVPLGQRAVAVVPPISQQSPEDQNSGILNVDSGLPFKILRVWTLTEKEFSAQQTGSVVSVPLPNNKGSSPKVLDSVFTTSAPSLGTDSSPPTQKALSPLEKLAQISNSVGPVLSTAGTSVTAQMEGQTLNPPGLESQCVIAARQIEGSSDVSSSSCNSETQPKVDSIESGSQEREFEKNAFDLTNVPVSKWTMAQLNKLVTFFEFQQGTCEEEFDIDKVISTYGGFHHNTSDVFSSDAYVSIIKDASSVSTLDKNSVICSQVLHKFRKEVAQNFRVIRNGEVCFSDFVYKSSWLNLNEQLDDIDKEHGFPFHLRFGKCTLLEENESKELKKTKSCKLPEASNEQEKNLPVPTILSEAEQPTLSEECASDDDPLSSIQITLLTHEEAKRYFSGEQSICETAEHLHSEVPEPNGEENENKIELGLPEQPLIEKEKSHMEVYCCLKRWMAVMTGCEKKCTCSCQSESAQKRGQKSVNTADAEKANDKGVTVKSSFQETSDPNMADKATETEHRSLAKCKVENEFHRRKCKNMRSPVAQNSEICVKGLSELSTTEDKADIVNAPTSVSSGSNVVGVEIQDICSSSGEVHKIACTVPKPLRSKCISKHESKNQQWANVDENSLSMGTTGTDNASLGSVTLAKCGMFSQQEVEDTDGHFFQKYSASEKPSNRKRKRKQRVEIANSTSTSPIHDDLHHSQRKSRKGKSCSEAVGKIKAALLDYNDRTCLQTKRKSNNVESIKSKVPKLVEGEHPRNVHIDNGENGTMPREEKLFEVVPTHEKTNSVSLALYGSSPQRRHGTLRSNRTSDGKLCKSQVPVGRPSLPPATISLTIASEKTHSLEICSPVKSHAKQQVFAKWKSSFVSTKKCTSKGKATKLKNAKGACKCNGVGPKIPSTPPATHPKQPEHSTGRTNVRSSPRKVTPIRLCAVTKRQEKVNGEKRMLETVENEPFAILDDQKNHKSTSARRPCVGGRPRDLTTRSLPLCDTKIMNKLKLGRVRKGEPVRQRRHSLPVTGLSDAETKRKYKIGNPALTPGQEENILEFKLLPKSFSFEDGQDCTESVKQRQAKKTETDKVSSKQSESLKKTTWKLQGSFSKSSEGKGLREVRSPSASMQSGTIFQEFKKKYMEKARK